MRSRSWQRHSIGSRGRQWSGRAAYLTAAAAIATSLLASAAQASSSQYAGRTGHALIRAAVSSITRSGPAPAWAFIGPFGQDAAGQAMASGRIQDLAVDPFNGSHLLALADSGLWQSTNGGRTWTGLTGLDRFGQWDFQHGSLAFDPLVRGVVLIASPQDNRTRTEVGIYRSTDGGQNWQSAINFQARCADGTTIGSPSVVVFAGHNAYAAASCEVGVSNDDGSHWTWSAPDSGGQFSGVTVDSAGTPFTCGNDGVFMLFKGVWKQVVDFNGAGWSAGTPVSVPAIALIGSCRIVAAQKQPMHVFFAASWSGLPFNCGTNCTMPGSDIFEAYVDNSGPHTQDLRGSRFANGRDVLVQTRPDPAGGFDLFWHNTDLLYYQRCSDSATFECTPGSSGSQAQPNPPWTMLGYDLPPGLHADATRMIFQSGSPFCIRFIADDSGIEKPNPGNCNGTAKSFSYSDVGINATEFYEIATTSITGLRNPTTDLYAAAQDNGAFVRLSAGGWTQRDPGNDGLAVDATVRVHVTSLRGLRVIRTFYSSDGNPNLGGRDLANLRSPSAADLVFKAPCTGMRPNNQHQLDQVGTSALVMLCVLANGSSSIYSGPLVGSGWAQLTGTQVTGQPNGLPGESLFVTAPTATTTGYVVQDNGNLWIIHPPRTPRRQLMSWNVGPVAVSHDGQQLMTFVCPPSPDTCDHGEVLATSDGGVQWHFLRAALDLGTRDRWGHSYRLDIAPSTNEISALAIDPYNSRIWALGTLDVGLLVSSDSGRSWQRTPIIAPNINSMRFDESNRIYVGTYGRGVFGGIEPEPDQLALVAKAGKIVPQQGQAFRWTATARTFSGAAISGRIIRFIRINLDDGTRTEAGLAATNAHGMASRSAIVPAGHYAIEAIWQPRNGDDLETQTTFTAQS
jgi:hypothetical protein